MRACHGPSCMRAMDHTHPPPSSALDAAEWEEPPDAGRAVPSSACFACFLSCFCRGEPVLTAPAGLRGEVPLCLSIDGSLGTVD